MAVTLVTYELAEIPNYLNAKAEAGSSSSEVNMSMGMQPPKAVDFEPIDIDMITLLDLNLNETSHHHTKHW